MLVEADMEREPHLLDAWGRAYSVPSGEVETVGRADGRWFCQALFPRGTGFGNRLFLWARCRLFARAYGATMVSPIWFRPAVGQLFRGGIDYGSYLRQIALFRLFQKRPDDWSAVAGRLRTLGTCCINETELADEGGLLERLSARPVKVLFDAPVYDFRALNGEHEFLREELRAITRGRFLKTVEQLHEVPIGINIRMGNDFSAAPVLEQTQWVGWLQKTPLSWFKDTLLLLREEIGYPAHAVVVSDGTPESLREILSMENITHLRPGAAISDLLTLARAKVLLASGSSTFSAWAGFTGQMPAITAPGHPLMLRAMTPERGQYIGAFDPAQPDETFLQQARAALQR